MPEEAPLDLRGATQLAFATPLIGYRWPDAEALNAALRGLILETERRRPGMPQRSNVGGWHSTPDFLDRPEEPVRELRRRVERMAQALLDGSAPEPAARTFRLEAWANVLRDGDYHGPHNHPNAVWSGVYYVAAGGGAAARPAAGELELLDPRVGANMAPFAGEAFERRVRIRPAEGLMVCFPAWLRHLTHPHAGPGERISVAFNVQWGPAATDVNRPR
jgi:uncharacterized protein (TIGR02466 family)